jgi:hypothetical protein
MPDIGRTGFDAFHFDSKNLPDESLDAIGPKVRLVGNVNNPKALFTGAPEAAYAETMRALDAGVPAVGPECAVPLRAPTKNLKAISRAATEFPALSQADREEWRSRAEVYNLPEKSSYWGLIETSLMFKTKLRGGHQAPGHLTDGSSFILLSGG